MHVTIATTWSALLDALAKRPVTLACLLFIALVPSIEFIPALQLYDQKRLLQVALLCLTALKIIAGGARSSCVGVGFMAFPVLARHALAGIVVLGCLSAWHAAAPLAAALEVSLAILLFALAVAVADELTDAPLLLRRGLAIAVAVSAVLYLAKFLGGYAAAMLAGDKLVWPEPFAGFSNPRFFSQFQSLTLPLMMLPFVCAPGNAKTVRILALLLGWGWWMLLFASGTRGTLLAMAVALVAVPVLLPRQAKHWLWLQLQAAAGGFMLYGLMFYGVGQGQTDFTQTAARIASMSSSGRAELWMIATDAIGCFPLLGIGPQNYALLGARFGAHPHNALLQFAAEWGLIATAIIVALVGWAFLKWIMSVRSTESGQHAGTVLRVSLTGAMIAGITHSLVSGVMVMPLSQTTLAVICGWALACYRLGTAHTAATRYENRQSRQWIGGISLASAALVLASVTAYDASYLHARSAWQREPVPFGEQPRFWQQKMPSSRPTDEARAHSLAECVMGAQ